MSIPTVAGLDCFHACTRDWFAQAFESPTQIQLQAWPRIASGESTLLLAPTGSGKTLAAFLASLDRLFFAPPPENQTGVRVLYISPLKALGVDVDRNLRGPLAGLRAWAERSEVAHQLPTVGVRSGDTPARDRAAMLKNPPEILITTPESLYLMLTSSAESILAGVETVIVDEIHAVAATKRGVHLFATLERLEWLRREHADGDLRPLQRIGLSATQRPLERIARLLAGGNAPIDQEAGVVPRPVEIVDCSAERNLHLAIETPADEIEEETEASDDLDLLPATPAIPSVWPSIHPRLVELIRTHRSTMIFVNSRRLAERLATAINELAEEELALAHHGSIAKDTRALIEDRLKRGDLPAIVATSSMELGIDMGAVDLVIQIEAPPSIASGLQRIGRSGHHVGGESRGVIFPKFRGDLLACSAATGAMQAGWVEETTVPKNPLDILAQQIVAMTCRVPMAVEQIYAVIRGAAPFFELPWSSFLSVLDLLSGRYPSDEFAELRPRINWDRISGTVSPRKGAQRLAILNGGTIPDRGLYGVHLVGSDGETAGRVGELDEEMVFECRPGDVFLLGASSWRVMDIDRDRVLVTPAPGEPGRMPFWRGDSLGRPLAFGRAIGELTRELTNGSRRSSLKVLTEERHLMPSAAESLIDYIQEQVKAANAVPSDQTILMETFPDEVGDWRVVLLTPFGARVHAPWATIVAARLRRETQDEVDMMWTDDGIVFRLPDVCQIPPVDLFLPEPEEVEEELIAEVAGTAMFAARFRENAGRSLLLPRRQPGRRTPLWQQRRRAADLLKVASRFSSFPIVMETFRECLRDEFDLPGLCSILSDVRSHKIRVQQVQSEQPSPFAAAVMFNYVGNFIYDGDAPLAERRAQTLSLDQAQLRELLGTVDLREVFDADVIVQFERELQRLDGYQARHPDDVHGLLLQLGPLSQTEIIDRCTEETRPSIEAWLNEMLDARRIFSFQLEERTLLAAAEDAGRLRDTLGIMPPPGLAEAFLAPVVEALCDLVSRFARTHGPFTAEDAARRLGLTRAAVLSAIADLVAQQRLVEGEFLPGRTGSEWCETNVLRQLRRRSLAALRQEVEPVDPEALVRFLPQWHGISERRRGLDALLDVVEQLQGAPLPASTLEEEILPARLQGFRATDLDELALQGEIIWRGFDSTGPSDGRIGLYLADSFSLLAPPAGRVEGATAQAIRDLLQNRQALLFDQLVSATGDFPNDLLQLLWQMVWVGELSNDTLTPIRSLRRSGQRRSQRSSVSRTRRFRSRRRSALPGSEGRWSLLPNADQACTEEQPGLTERQTATAFQLIERHGVLTKEMLAREEVVGGFAGLYPVLKAMEEAGRVRRGYFVAGLGAAQFSSPGAEDRLRGCREPAEEGSVQVFAATDPASPWGNAFKWPDSPATARPQRVAGARVIVVNGYLAAWLNRNSNRLITFSADQKGLTKDSLAAAVAGLAEPGLPLLLSQIDGEAAADSELRSELESHGFRLSSRGLLHRGH